MKNTELIMINPAITIGLEKAGSVYRAYASVDGDNLYTAKSDTADGALSTLFEFIKSEILDNFKE